MEYRQYQKEIIEKGLGILKTHRFLYLAMEVRTGKTLTSLGLAERLNCKNVLFITKKKQYLLLKTTISYFIQVMFSRQ